MSSLQSKHILSLTLTALDPSPPNRAVRPGQTGCPNKCSKLLHCGVKISKAIAPLTSAAGHIRGLHGIHYLIIIFALNPFTPESDQCQISPPAPPEILHHTVWRTWLFIAYSDEKWLYYKFSLHHSYNRFLKGWENTLFELRSERVNIAMLV